MSGYVVLARGWVQTSSAEAIKIIQDRLPESLEEIRESVDPKK